jgi:hypothetical protein
MLVSSYIRNSAHAYPALLALHIVALIVLGGAIVATDLRLLGLALRTDPAAEVMIGLRRLKRWSFVVAAACGVLLFGAKADRYWHNPWFWAKMLLLALVAANYLVFRRTITPATMKVTAALSLFLWTGMVVAARGPASVKDIMHSVVDPSGDFLFQSVRIIGDETGAHEKVPQTDAEWDDVRARARALQNARDVLVEPGRMAGRPRDRSKNPQVENEPEEVQALMDANHEDFARRAQRLYDAASISMKAVDAKDKDALLRSLDGIDKACESCHLHYWYPKDQRAQEAAKADGVE